ncbi:MAG: hemolysin [Ignavibacteria bacterium GWB2_35_12]|nr:MAG: hemolysin [Ignavibacteria bacterium GWA2_35_8]OGU42292.1 MAG: hemolysin [Ignavibacteria bacterium GWB2_35_12]OGU86412.1 MAG: hemolysin [Ignavibacteria bacterium RIFOXYA2_FULL_35_10]OGV22132.1 MAG: hemolysin [Ignavibacteria bacterium RIFOXYC2_FULL_35_21]
MLLNITLTLLLVLLNGFFVAAEFAIVKVRASQLELRIRTGSKIARLSMHLINNLNAYLSATQLGITVASLGLGWIGEPVVSEIIKTILYLFGLHLNQQALHSIALPTAFITITILHIILGELAPKTLAIQKPEQTALMITIPLRIFYIVFSPFIWFLNTLANLVLKLFGFQTDGKEYELHSAEEIRYLLEESQKSGVIGVSEHELLENVFEFSDTPVKQIMIPRGKIIGVEISMEIKKVLETFIDEGYSRMPIYKGSIDDILGVIYAKDLINLMHHNNLFVIQDIIRPAFFIQEEEKINVVLRRMQKEKVHLAIVLDEFGGTAGLITLEDIMEEIFGEIQDEYDEEMPIVEKTDELTFRVNALAAISDANVYLPEPLPESEDYETIGGLITSEVGRIPDENELIDFQNYQCKIIKRSERSIEQVLLKYVPYKETLNIND